MTEHCECGAPPDSADEHHACAATKPEPLRVCVARARGCRIAVLETEPERIYACACPPEVEGHRGADLDFLPYGEDTPEGWACTGPLISRFGLSIMAPLWRFEAQPGGMRVWSETNGTFCSHLDRCRGAAEWVAEHSAAAIVREREVA